MSKVSIYSIEIKELNQGKTKKLKGKQLKF